jgi:formyl-CoA transferase
MSPYYVHPLTEFQSTGPSLPTTRAEKPNVYIDWEMMVTDQGIDANDGTGTVATRQGPLTDLRVIEMGQLLAGPFCGQLLADFGAEVIKLEQPGTGDPMREWGREKPHGKSLWWPVVARNKKSVTLNLREKAAQQIVRDLVAKSDILIENFRPGTMERWGLGYDVLSQINPKLVMVRVTGFGQTGPYSSQAGYGSIGEAMGGLRYVVGDPSTAPSRMGISIGDSLAATYAALGALMAVHARERTGRGQVVDSAIYEAVLAMMESLVTEYDQTGYVRERTGPILPNVAPSNVYPTSDGQMILIAANQDTVFKRLADAMGRPELASDPRYATHSARGAVQQDLDDLISDWTRTVESGPLLDLMEKHGVPAGRIYRAPEMMEDPHFKARQNIIKVAHPIFGKLAMQNVAPRLSDTPGGVVHPGPELGEHTVEVLGGILGLDEGRLAELKTAGII